MDNLIYHANSKGLATRCVTNGFWAKTPELATHRLTELKKQGLTEINFSAGFAHQKFIPTEFVINGVLAAAGLDMTVLISAERIPEKDKKGTSLKEHPRIAHFLKANPEKSKFIKVLSTVWVKNNISAQSGTAKSKPCDNILDALVITPDLRMKSCCGLTVNAIPEMDMGLILQSNILERYRHQFDDFLKIWLRVDGPQRIIEILRRTDNELQPLSFSHPCQACQFLYTNEKMRNLLRKSFATHISDVLFRFSATKEISTRANNLIGYGA